MKLVLHSATFMNLEYKKAISKCYILYVNIYLTLEGYSMETAVNRDENEQSPAEALWLLCLPLPPESAGSRCAPLWLTRMFLCSFMS